MANSLYSFTDERATAAALIEARGQMFKLPSADRFERVPDPLNESVTLGLRPLRFGAEDKVLIVDPALPDLADGDMIEQRIVRLALMAQALAVDTGGGQPALADYLTNLNVELSAVAKVTGINYTIEFAPEFLEEGGAELPSRRVLWQWHDEICAERCRENSSYYMHEAGRLDRQGAKKLARRYEQEAKRSLEREREHEHWAERWRKAAPASEASHARRSHSARRVDRHRRSSHGAKTTSRQSARRAASRSPGASSSSSSSDDPGGGSDPPGGPSRRLLAGAQPHSAETRHRRLPQRGAGHPRGTDGSRDLAYYCGTSRGRSGLTDSANRPRMGSPWRRIRAHGWGAMCSRRILAGRGTR